MTLLANDLREAVLEAAIQGKITNTLKSDTPVFHTTSNFTKEKEKLLKLKKMKDRGLFKPIVENEKYFDIPDSWEWVRINDIGVYKKGPFGSALTKSMFVKKGNSAIKVYEQKNAIQKSEKLGEYYISKDYYESNMIGFTVESGDILVSCAGTIGETYIMPDKIEVGIINQALMRMNLVESINTKYFMLVFDHILKSEARSKSGGTAIKNIPPFEVFKAMTIPLPPIEEQERIVVRVEELMTKIDEYEKIENQLMELQKNFPEDMRNALLQAAMQGKLTEQLAEDGIVDTKLIKAKDNSLMEDCEYEIPDTWRLGTLESITDSVATKKYQIKESEVQSQGLYPVVSQSKEPSIGFSNAIDKLYKCDKPIIVFGDHTCVVKIIDFDFIVGADGTKLFIPNDAVSPRYLFYAMMFITRDLSLKGGYTRHYKYIKNTPIPIPPITEQKRIVDKLDQLLPLCESLNKNIE